MMILRTAANEQIEMMQKRSQCLIGKLFFLIPSG
jgi:hypothetical protein